MEVLEGFKRDTYVHMDNGGHLWLISKNEVGGSKYFKCFEKTCGGTCVDNGCTVQVRREHNHAPNLEHIDHLKFLAKLRHLAATTNDSFKDIFSMSQRAHEDGALVAGGYHQCVHIMKSARSVQLPSVPKKMTDFANAMMDKE